MTLVCRWTMCIANQWLTSSGGGEDEAVAAAPDHHQLHLHRGLGHRRRQVATVLSRNLLETNVMPGTYKFIDVQEEVKKKKKKFH